MGKESKLLNRTQGLIDSIHQRDANGEDVAGIVIVSDGDKWSGCCIGDEVRCTDLFLNLLLETEGLQKTVENALNILREKSEEE